MDILFVDNFPINFGVGYISAVLKNAKHNVQLLVYPFSKFNNIDIYMSPEKYFNFTKIADEVLLTSPDLVCFSAFSSNYQFLRHLSYEIKKRCNVPILVGGVLATLDPKLMLSDTACDYVLRGEVETIINDFVISLPYVDRSTSGLAYRDGSGQLVCNEIRSYVRNLDALPSYDRTLYPTNSKILYVITSRGCPMSCAYCSAGLYSAMISGHGAALVRKRSVDAVIKEIAEAMKQREYDIVYFYDDCFVLSKKWLKEFSEKYVAINIPYYCEVLPSSITPEVASMLKSSNCREVFMGFQTANDEYKKNVLNRNENKSSVQSAIQIFNEVGISFQTDHIFGFPGETMGHIEESLDFYVFNKIKILSISFLNYYGDSVLARYALRERLISEKQYEDICKNRIIGEQSYKGTIIDEHASTENVKIACLFRLISYLPGCVIKYIFRNKLYRIFPSNKFFYYGLSFFDAIHKRGYAYIRLVLDLSFSKIKHKVQR